jgi:hypothetical protein
LCQLPQAEKRTITHCWNWLLLLLFALLQVKQQLVQSQKQAETAMAAEAAARAELQSLQQQLERHKEEAQAQAEAFEAAKMQLLALQVKTAQNRECLLRCFLITNVVTAGAEVCVYQGAAALPEMRGDERHQVCAIPLIMFLHTNCCQM